MIFRRLISTPDASNRKIGGLRYESMVTLVADDVFDDAQANRRVASSNYAVDAGHRRDARQRPAVKRTLSHRVGSKNKPSIRKSF